MVIAFPPRETGSLPKELDSSTKPSLECAIALLVVYLGAHFPDVLNTIPTLRSPIDLDVVSFLGQHVQCTACQNESSLIPADRMLDLDHPLPASFLLHSQAYRSLTSSL